MKLNSHTCPTIYIFIPEEYREQANQLAALIDPAGGGAFTFRDPTLSANGESPGTHCMCSTLMTPATVAALNGDGIEINVPDPENPEETVTQTLKLADVPWMTVFVKGVTAKGDQTGAEEGEVLTVNSMGDALGEIGLSFIPVEE